MRTFFLFATLVSLALASTAKSEALAVPDIPVLQVSTIPQPAQIKPVEIVFSQTDPRWSHVRLGRGTIGTEGCVIASLAIALARAGVPTDPLVLLHLLSENGLIDRNGRLMLSALGSVLPLTVVDRFSTTGDNTVQTVAERISSGMLVLLQLDHGASGRRGQHWVAAVQSSGSDISVIDPARGSGSLLALYGRLGVKKIIVLSLNKA